MVLKTSNCFICDCARR